MSDYTPLTPQEIYQKSLADSEDDTLTPETRVEWFLNKIVTTLEELLTPPSDDDTPSESEETPTEE